MPTENCRLQTEIVGLNKLTNTMRILYCVLNWGLGHSTRSIPVIRALQATGAIVDIASDGGPLALLRKTFPECMTLELPGYDIQYPTGSVLLNALSQSYKIVGAVRNEQSTTQKWMHIHHYDAIVSDNRYGCYHPSVPSILITHQISNIAKSPVLNIAGEWTINRFFKNFNEIWIPDTPDRALSGKMTESRRPNIRFIGHLSDQVYSPQSKQFDVAAILSGPEPQRSKLEEEILLQLKRYPGKCALVRGVITDDLPGQEDNVTIYPYLDRVGINTMSNSAEIIICRTGYSSLMDLINVGTKAILIPTPGQPEQLYLGERLTTHPQFVVQEQGGVDVDAGVMELKSRKVQISKERHDERLLESALIGLAKMTTKVSPSLS